MARLEGGMLPSHEPCDVKETCYWRSRSCEDDMRDFYCPKYPI